MRIADLQLRLGRLVILRTEPLEEFLDDPEGFDGLDMLVPLLLDEPIKGLHDVLRVVGVEITIPIIDRDIVLAWEAVDRAVLPPDLLLFEFGLMQLFHLGEVRLTVLLLVVHPVDKRLEADDVVLHGCLRCSSSVVDGA